MRQEARNLITYELRVRVDPSNGHQSFGDLRFEELNLVIHGALVLLACLRWNDNRGDDELPVPLFAR